MRSLTPIVLAACLCSPLPAQSLQQEVAGRVVKDGAPVAGARVHLLMREYPITNTRLVESAPVKRRSASTDAEGRFSFEAPCWRKLSLYAELPDKGLASLPIDDVDAPAGALELQLVEAWKLGGRLAYKGREPGEEVPFRLIRVSGHNNAIPIRVEGRAKADGSFMVEGLPPGPWSLELGGKKRRLEEPFVFDASRTDYDIPLVRAISLTVRAVTARGPAGKPIAGARVLLLDPVQYQETVTDAQGMCVLDGLLRGPGATFMLEGPGLKKSVLSLEPGLDPRAEAPQAEVVVGPGRRMHGKIVAADGSPAAGWVVVFEGKSHPTGLPVADLTVGVETDAEGRFDTTALDPAVFYEAWLLLPEGEPQAMGRVLPRDGKEDMGTFRAGSCRLELTLKLPQDVMAPQGRVRMYGSKESGELFRPWSLVPAGGNRYLGQVVLPGEYLVAFESKTLGLSATKAYLLVAQDATPTKVILPVGKPRKLVGRVVDPGDKPIAHRKVQLVPAGADAEGGSGDWTHIVLMRLRADMFPEDKYPRSTVTGDDGSFELSCFFGFGQFDLLVDGPPGPDANQSPMPPTRTTDILSRPNPIVIPGQ
ncbi:MAG: carboxypeptidase-like regulatory domain-containing protein [Planctomycetota bacterium]